MVVVAVHDLVADDHVAVLVIAEWFVNGHIGHAEILRQLQHFGFECCQLRVELCLGHRTKVRDRLDCVAVDAVFGIDEIIGDVSDDNDFMSQALQIADRISEFDVPVFIAPDPDVVAHGQEYGLFFLEPCDALRLTVDKTLVDVPEVFEVPDIPGQYQFFT